ncbi:hypothetical protein BGZ89_004313 [Linnemannia elongata]|nr:hypothetical protein BGZ89_004313 [Linnemannia elongata]
MPLLAELTLRVLMLATGGSSGGAVLPPGDGEGVGCHRTDQPQRLDLGTTSVNHRHQDHWPSLHQSPIPETALNAGRVYHNQYPSKHNTLKLSFDSGLNRLGALMRLNKFQVLVIVLTRKSWIG